MRPNQPPTQPSKYDDGALRLTPTPPQFFISRNLLAYFVHHPIHRNSQPDVRTVSPVYLFALVTQDYVFCFLRLWRRGATVSLRKGKETKQRGVNIYWRRGTPRQASAQRRYCAVSFFWSFVLLSWEGVFLT